MNPPQVREPSEYTTLLIKNALLEKEITNLIDRIVGMNNKYDDTLKIMNLKYDDVLEKLEIIEQNQHAQAIVMASVSERSGGVSDLVWRIGGGLIILVTGLIVKMF